MAGEMMIEASSVLCLAMCVRGSQKEDGKRRRTSSRYLWPLHDYVLPMPWSRGLDPTVCHPRPQLNHFPLKISQEYGTGGHDCVVRVLNVSLLEWGQRFEAKSLALLCHLTKGCFR